MILRTGILGGTFDPVHKGHLALATAAGKLCNLDEVILLPAAVPPHKQERSITSFSHRVAMLELAIQDQTCMQISTIEQLLPSPSYTIDTLRYLKSHSPVALEFFFITGADTFLDLPTWKEHETLLGFANFVVFLRTGSNEEKLNRFLSQLGYAKREGHWHHESQQKRVYTSSDPLPDISSSEIRNRVAEGRPVAHMLPSGVDEYIRSRQLYSVGG